MKRMQQSREDLQMSPGNPSTLRVRAQQRLIRSILVPVDFSDCSLAGLKYAVRFAKELGARIVVLHVADLGPVMMTTGYGNYDRRFIPKRRGADVAIRCRLSSRVSVSMVFQSIPLPLLDTARPRSKRLLQSTAPTLSSSRHMAALVCAVH
jgi:Universal stress protein family